MRIQHNIMALNAHRNLTSNNNAVSKSLEKLSSGYRINRAGDDAAGLAISEKMRSQITGLKTAQKNAEDGVSLVQTAEGALTEVHSMLNRMVELATQAKNGTYSQSNREEMQKEINALNEEIDRISNTANFNGTNLFGGTGGDTGIKGLEVRVKMANGTEIKPTQEQEASKYNFVAGMSFKSTTSGTQVEVTLKLSKEDGTTEDVKVSLPVSIGGVTMNYNASATYATEAFEKALEDYDINVNYDGTTITFEADKEGMNEWHVTGFTSDTNAATLELDADPKITEGFEKGAIYDLSGLTKDDQLIIGGKAYKMSDYQNEAALNEALKKDGMILHAADGGKKVQFLKDPNAAPEDSIKVSLHVGESSSDENAIEVNIHHMSTTSLNEKYGKIHDIDLTFQEGAKDAIDSINEAIDTVSSIRSDLGAMQNRLEHTINNIGVQTENITAAEARIRDVDMAKEMMDFTKNNILVQASQAMLAQANQVPQGVLQLLQ